MSWQTLDPKVKTIATLNLTRLQLEVLQARLDGNSWRVIADARGIHEATARGHWKAAVDRLKPHLDEIRKAAA